jgi:hypothetical protein
MRTTLNKPGNAVSNRMKRTASTETELPATIAGLWGLCPLTPLRTRAAYDEATAVCGKLAVRDLNAVQEEYHRELLELVENYEDRHGEAAKAHASLKALAGS